MRPSILKQAVTIVFSCAVPGLCLFLSAGRLDWWNAWLLLAIHAGGSTAGAALLARNPELRAERRNAKAGKGWDKPLAFFIALLGPIAAWITAGLDTRFHWSEAMPAWLAFAGAAVAIAAVALTSWAMNVNRFFSSVVRIQKDRGHQVVRSGPYRFVRHPGYTGMLAFTLATPLILNSRWAFVPAALTVAVMLLRTVLEDRTLHNELEGYSDYARTVKYRLAPLIW